MRLSNKNRLILFLLAIIAGNGINAQKTIQLGAFSFQTGNTPHCSYFDYSQGYKALVENYFCFEKDSAFSIDIWYSYEDDKKGEIKRITLEKGAIRDIDTNEIEIDSNDASERICHFSLFLPEKKNDHPDGFFVSRQYDEDSVNKGLYVGSLLLFGNDRKSLEGIIEKIKSHQ